MKKVFFISLIASLFIASFISAQEIDQKSISVTVYNSNLGVVRDLRAINLNPGQKTLSITDVAQYIDPTTVHIKLNGDVLEQNYQYDLVSLDKIMQKYIDKEVELISEDGQIFSGRLLSSFGGQLVLEKSEGGLLMLPNLSKYQISVGSLPEGLITKPTLVWMINPNESGKQDVEISYQTSGMNWHAEYVAVLNEDDTKLDLNSWVSVDNNSGTTYRNAKLKLVAGDVNRVQDRQRLYEAESMMMEMAKGARDQFEEKEFFEYHIYDLQRPTTLANRETKQISLFEASDVKANKKYFYRSGGYRGNNGKVAVIVEFNNGKDNNLGLPMPKGKVRVYKSDGDALEFIGEDLIDHTPRNEMIKLKIGDAFDILAEEKQTDNKRITNRVYEQTFEVKIKNRKKENVTVEVERYLGYNWEIINSSLDYEKKDAFTITYNVPVKADDETVVTYTVRYSN
ncbi:MAG: DUF4139 domain-containing protein [Melioribacteraceae bacterium]|nr:DUF4139 domain-containing protein [Melioribacteraceae bacterium]MCF8356316.1 DUF4139 domain-containing protein [Melioribacteraceae bacterium]MCF8394370.1 DUF4139 domain-containing protein [Melioribacteraceae bacterium]MCF8420080.1 DUF4139 domain-containing protein [Melioribacteraceae bacterium]